MFKKKRKRKKRCAFAVFYPKSKAVSDGYLGSEQDCRADEDVCSAFLSGLEHKARWGYHRASQEGRKYNGANKSLQEGEM